MKKLAVLALLTLGAVVLSYFLWLERTRRTPEAPLGTLADLSSLPGPASEGPWEAEGNSVRVYAEDGDEFRVYAAPDGRILGVQARFLSRGFAGPSGRLGKFADAWWDREVNEADAHSKSSKPAGASGQAAACERVVNEGLGLKGIRTEADTGEKDVDRVEYEIRSTDCPPLPKREAEGSED